MNQPVFNCYGVADNDDKLLLEKEAFTESESEAAGIAELLNTSARLTEEDKRAPYQHIAIYIKKVN